MKKASSLSLALSLFLAPAAVYGQAAAPAAPAAQRPVGAPAVGALDPISAYLRQDTQVALIVNLNQIDVDQLVQYAQAKAKEANIPQADLDKQMAEAKPQIDQAKQFIKQMKDAGVSRVYALINVQGAMQGNFGTVVIPTSSAENAKQVADMLKGLMNPNATDAPAQVTTAGTVALLQSKQAAAQPPAAGVGAAAGNPTLLSALRARGAGEAAALSLIIDANALAPFAQQVEGEDKALIQGTEWISLSGNFPPKPTFNATIKAKDAATAQKLVAKYNESLEKGKNDPQSKKVLGDTTQLYNVMKPEVKGDTVMLDLDTKEIETVVAPAFAKAANEMQKQQQEGGESVQPGAAGNK